jgi:hypothetical protein
VSGDECAYPGCVNACLPIHKRYKCVKCSRYIHPSPLGCSVAVGDDGIVRCRDDGACNDDLAGETVTAGSSGTTSISGEIEDPLVSTVAKSGTSNPAIEDPLVGTVAKSGTSNPAIEGPLVSTVAKSGTSNPEIEDPLASTVAKSGTSNPEIEDPLVGTVAKSGTSNPKENISGGIEDPLVSTVAESGSSNQKEGGVRRIGCSGTSDNGTPTAACCPKYTKVKCCHGIAASGLTNCKAVFRKSYVQDGQYFAVKPNCVACNKTLVGESWYCREGFEKKRLNEDGNSVLGDVCFLSLCGGCRLTMVQEEMGCKVHGSTGRNSRKRRRL